jgi:restriction system protein
MPRKRRRSFRRLFPYTAGLVLFLGLLVYSPVVTWWESIPVSSRFLLLAATGFAAMTVTGLIFAFFIYRKREREKIWKSAMAGWNHRGQASTTLQKQSALHLSDIELEKLAAQVYEKLGYKVQHVGQMGDHGIDVLLINPQNQKELVQCKQWSKPVGEPVLRDLYGAMMHDQAVRGWLWAPRGFTGPARAWAQGKSIVLVDDVEINRLIGIAYKNR